MPSTLYTSNVASYELRDEVEKRELCCVTLIAGRPRRAAVANEDVQARRRAILVAADDALGRTLVANGPQSTAT